MDEKTKEEMPNSTGGLHFTVNNDVRNNQMLTHFRNNIQRYLTAVCFTPLSGLKY